MRFRVRLTGLARMRGSRVVDAPDEKAAQEKMLTQLGDVLWEYDGIEDDTVEMEVEKMQ